MPEKAKEEPIFEFDHWGCALNYTGGRCPNCGRYRMELYKNGKEICEKCNWCPQENTYVNIDKMFEEKERYEYDIEMSAAMQESTLHKKEEEPEFITYGRNNKIPLPKLTEEQKQLEKLIIMDYGHRYHFSYGCLLLFEF